LDFKKNKTILIAYEPIWAIGTGEAANITDIDRNIKIIKNIINDINTKDCNICLLYGGSVDENNASNIFSINEVDGFLIGTSSLSIDSFYKIYRQI
jgi:triosephosphate isomerase